MQRQPSSLKPGVGVPAPSPLALNEHDLAARWRLSVKTLRRWRQQLLGPAPTKLGSRVIYLLSEIEAHERRCSRYSVGARVSV